MLLEGERPQAGLLQPLDVLHDFWRFLAIAFLAILVYLNFLFFLLH